MGEARHSFQDITEEEGFSVGVLEEGQETKFCEDGEGDGRHIDANRLRGGKDGTTVVVNNVDGGEVGVGRDNRMKQSVDSGEAVWCLHRNRRLSCLPLSSISPSSSGNNPPHPTSPSPPA